MEKGLKLFMVMLGCTPKGRVTEQHDIFFGIEYDLKNLIPQMDAFWPEAKGKLHIDCWREVTLVDGYQIEIVKKTEAANNPQKLFFINLGGYKPNEFEEYHYKVLAVADSLASATKKSKETTFYKHYGFKGATSHIDDKYGIDVDDIHNVADLFPEPVKAQYGLKITKTDAPEDVLHIGYVILAKLLK